MPQPLADIVMAATALKGIAPNQFQMLCEAFRAYEVQTILELGSADGNDVYRAQGKLKSVQQLKKHLVECTELRSTFERRETNARHAPVQPAATR
jgi:hypothetical protein